MQHSPYTDEIREQQDREYRDAVVRDRGKRRGDAAQRFLWMLHEARQRLSGEQKAFLTRYYRSRHYGFQLSPADHQLLEQLPDAHLFSPSAAVQNLSAPQLGQCDPAHFFTINLDGHVLGVDVTRDTPRISSNPTPYHGAPFVDIKFPVYFEHTLAPAAIEHLNVPLSDEEAAQCMCLWQPPAPPPPLAPTVSDSPKRTSPADGADDTAMLERFKRTRLEDTAPSGDWWQADDMDADDDEYQRALYASLMES